MWINFGDLYLKKFKEGGEKFKEFSNCKNDVTFVHLLNCNALISLSPGQCLLGIVTQLYYLKIENSLQLGNTASQNKMWWLQGFFMSVNFKRDGGRMHVSLKDVLDSPVQHDVPGMFHSQSPEMLMHLLSKDPCHGKSTVDLFPQ